MSGHKSWRLVLGCRLCLLLVLAGCSPKGPVIPKVAAVTGTVTLDGQPLAGASVSFSHPSGASGVAITDAKGHYELTSYHGPRSEARGVVPQDYQVIISKLVPPKGMTQKEYQAKVDAANTIASTGVVLSPQQQPPTLRQLLAPQYSNTAKTELKASVTDKGKNQFDFALNGAAMP